MWVEQTNFQIFKNCRPIGSRKSKNIEFWWKRSKYICAGSNKQNFTNFVRERQVSQNLSSFVRESQNISELRRTKWNILDCVENVEHFFCLVEKVVGSRKLRKFIQKIKTSQNSVEKNQIVGREGLETQKISNFGRES